MTPQDSASNEERGISRRSVLLAAGIVPATMLTGRVATAAGAQPAGSPEPRQYLPVPERARPPVIPPKGYLVDDLGGGLHGVRFGGSQAMFLVTRAGVVVVDAPFNPVNPGQQLMAAIREVTDRPVSHFVYSHAHADHVAAARIFGDKVEYVAHELTAERLRRANDPRRPVPTRTFAGKRHVLKVGGERLVLDYHGNVHQEGNIFIYAPEQRTLMLVDVIAPRWAPYFQLHLNQHDLPFYMEVVNKIIPDYDFETFVGGHRGWYGTRADIEEHGRYMADLQAATRRAFAEVEAGPNVVAGIDPANGWAISQVFYNTVADRAAELMPTSWLTRLGGADVFLRENTHAMAYSLAID